MVHEVLEISSDDSKELHDRHEVLEISSDDSKELGARYVIVEPEPTDSKESYDERETSDSSEAESSSDSEYLPRSVKAVKKARGKIPTANAWKRKPGYSGRAQSAEEDAGLIARKAAALAKEEIRNRNCSSKLTKTVTDVKSSYVNEFLRQSSHHSPTEHKAEDEKRMTVGDSSDKNHIKASVASIGTAQNVNEITSYKIKDRSCHGRKEDSKGESDDPGHDKKKRPKQDPTCESDDPGHHNKEKPKQDSTCESDDPGHHNQERPKEDSTREADYPGHHNKKRIEENFTCELADPAHHNKKRSKEDSICGSEDRRHHNTKRSIETCESEDRRHLNTKLSTETCEIAREDIRFEKSSEGDGQGRCTNDEFDIDAMLTKDLNDSLVPFGDVGVNIFLLILWFNKEKQVMAQKMGITLSEKEMKLKTSIKARSHARGIANLFHPNSEPCRLLCRPADMTNCIQASKVGLERVYEEIDGIITNCLPEAKGNVGSAIERLSEDVERAAADAIEDALAQMEGTLNVAIKFLGDVAITTSLVRQWFSREKESIRNEIWITLSDDEVKQQEYFGRICHQICLPRQYGQRQTLKAFKVNLLNDLSRLSIRIQQDLQRIDVMITQGLPAAMRNAELELESITEAVQKAVHAITSRQPNPE